MGANHSINQPPPTPLRWTSSIKIEVILFEQMVFPIEEREVYHPYSDGLSKKPLTIPCYSIHEVLAEKLRALIQRSYTAPRDFFDIWYLSQHVPNIDWKTVAEAFHKKMRFKNLTFQGIDQIINEENDRRLRAAWKNSLGHQIPEKSTVAYETVTSSIKALLHKIFWTVVFLDKKTSSAKIIHQLVIKSI